jgi:hypothetical protein
MPTNPLLQSSLEVLQATGPRGRIVIGSGVLSPNNDTQGTFLLAPTDRDLHVLGFLTYSPGSVAISWGLAVGALVAQLDTPVAAAVGPRYADIAHQLNVELPHATCVIGGVTPESELLAGESVLGTGFPPNQIFFPPGGLRLTVASAAAGWAFFVRNYAPLYVRVTVWWVEMDPGADPLPTWP